MPPYLPVFVTPAVPAPGCLRPQQAPSSTLSSTPSSSPSSTRALGLRRAQPLVLALALLLGPLLGPLLGMSGMAGMAAPLLAPLPAQAAAHTLSRAATPPATSPPPATPSLPLTQDALPGNMGTFPLPSGAADKTEPAMPPEIPQIAEDALATPSPLSVEGEGGALSGTAKAKAAQAPLPPLPVVDKVISAQATSPLKLDIQVHYPELKLPAVDKQLALWAENMSANFQENITKEASPEDHTAYEMQGSYTVTRPSATAVSITYQMHTYTGGAHGNLDILTLNFDCESGDLLTLEHIFNDVEQALELMSTYCYTVLNAELGDDNNALSMLKNGTTPDAENFSALTLVPEGIIVRFQPYQVAPWSAGPRAVRMGLADLANAQPQLELWGRRRE